MLISKIMGSYKDAPSYRETHAITISVAFWPITAPKSNMEAQTLLSLLGSTCDANYHALPSYSRIGMLEKAQSDCTIETWRINKEAQLLNYSKNAWVLSEEDNYWPGDDGSPTTPPLMPGLCVEPQQEPQQGKVYCQTLHSLRHA